MPKRSFCVACRPKRRIKACSISSRTPDPRQTSHCCQCVLAHSELSPSQCALALGLCLGAAHTFQGGRLLLHVLRTVVPSGDAQKESSSTLPEEEGKD